MNSSVFIKRVASQSKHGKALYKCACGNEFVAFVGNVNRAHTNSCGCLKKVSMAKVGRSNKRHGHSIRGKVSPSYHTWLGMRNRCANPNNSDYDNYGGRGITVCSDWVESFEKFVEDMGLRPSGKTIDRIDNNGNYEPSNCRWASYKEQRHNQRPR